MPGIDALSENIKIKIEAINTTNEIRAENKGILRILYDNKLNNEYEYNKFKIGFM